MTAPPRVSARVTPQDHLEILSQIEVSKLRDTSDGGLYDLFRRCALAVLNSGRNTDDVRQLMASSQDFDIDLLQQDRGIILDIKNAPSSAFVDGEMIEGIKTHLFSVLRDILYAHSEVAENPQFDLTSSNGITNAVFHILRHAQVLRADATPNMVVCWGGHAISREEYDYTKEVGYQLGLRGLDVCTGCGPGAMKGPMKGAMVGHMKQRITNGNYVGLTEPGIIASESPNPIVNSLVIMPDIEKRLEAFVRLAHTIIIFPGGPGTAEEMLYLLGVLLHPENIEQPFPLILTGPRSSQEYFRQLHIFIGKTLGFEAQQRYKIIIDDPMLVAREVKVGVDAVRRFRQAQDDAYYFNWHLQMDKLFQEPFDPNHESMANLSLHMGQEHFQLASNLRRAFSGIVAGNVKESGVRAIEEHGEFEIHGEPELMHALDKLLSSFVEQKRMRLPGSQYVPCYKVVT
ncbi:MAG: nucleotide 5'-monophosphate nucleosidase PpnN [Pseudomonadota bacterium]